MKGKREDVEKVNERNVKTRRTRGKEKNYKIRPWGFLVVFELKKVDKLFNYFDKQTRRLYGGA